MKTEKTWILWLLLVWLDNSLWTTNLEKTIGSGLATCKMLANYNKLSNTILKNFEVANCEMRCFYLEWNHKVQQNPSIKKNIYFLTCIIACDSFTEN